MSTTDQQLDEQLLAKYQESGAAADLGELFERHLARVRNVAYRIVLCNATADDITQEVFVKVIRSAHSFRGEANFSTWVYLITVNTANEYLRKQTIAKKRLESKPAANASDTNNRPSERPDQAAIHEETVAEIESALAKLSPKLRTAIVLTATEHLSPKEAAAIEGCTTATMHWRVHQARKQLRQLLQ